MSGLTRPGARGLGGPSRQELARVEADDVRRRFLQSILQRIDVQRVEELHLFSPIRQGGNESGVALIAVSPADAQASRSRHTIYTGRYRLTLRGPERGKWEFDLIEEADAPLDAVDAVVRGVHERSGEPTDCERIAGDELRLMTADPAWNAAR